MQLTTEQERAVMSGHDRHVDAIRRAMDGAQRAIFGACRECWYNTAAKGCRGRDCPMVRIAREIEKCRRMMRHGKLMPSWYIEAKRAETMADVPFIGTKAAATV